MLRSDKRTAPASPPRTRTCRDRHRAWHASVRSDAGDACAGNASCRRHACQLVCSSPSFLWRGCSACRGVAVADAQHGFRNQRPCFWPRRPTTPVRPTPCGWWPPHANAPSTGANANGACGPQQSYRPSKHGSFAAASKRELAHWDGSGQLRNIHDNVARTAGTWSPVPPACSFPNWKLKLGSSDAASSWLSTWQRVAVSAAHILSLACAANCECAQVAASVNGVFADSVPVSVSTSTQWRH